MVFTLTHLSLASEELIVTKGQYNLSIKPVNPFWMRQHTGYSIERFTRHFLFQHDHKNKAIISYQSLK